MATVSKRSKSKKFVPFVSKDVPTDYQMIDGIKVYDLGTRTIPEFLAFAETRKETSSYAIDTVRHMLAHGDAKTEARFETYRANHRLRIESPNVGECYNVSGSFVDIGRYMSGEPECMIDYTSDQPVSFLTVKIRCAHTSGDYFAYYANICDLVDYLESKGTRCRIVAQMNHGNWSEHNYNKVVGYRELNAVNGLCDVIVKDYAEAFSVSTFCAIFFHVEFATTIYKTANSITGQDVMGIDAQYNTSDRQGDPNAFTQSPDITDHIIFPSMWFDGYSNKFGHIEPMGFFRQIGIAELID